MMLAAWDAASARLLVTEGDRRRMRLELERDRDRRMRTPSQREQAAAAWQRKLTAVPS